MPDDICPIGDRMRVNVRQAPRVGNSRYPFLGESELSCLIHDIYLAHPPRECPGRRIGNNELRYRLPLQIASVSNFLPPSGTWSRLGFQWEDWFTNWEDSLGDGSSRRDLVIADADGAIVFDTLAEGATYQVIDWGADGRQILQWITETKILRILILWTADTYLGEEEVDVANSQIDSRTHIQVPYGVRSITADSMGVTRKFKLRAGYNTKLDVENVGTGLRRKTRVTVNAVAGEGLGKTPGCGAEDGFLRFLNDQGPDVAGRVTLDVDACYRIQVPVAIAGNLAVPVDNSLQIWSGCQPVCPSDYYVRTYAGLTNVWNKWQAIATTLETARDLYRTNRDRWLDQRDCRMAHSAKIYLQPELDCQLAVTAVFCNASRRCLAPVEFRFAIARFGVSIPETDPITQCGDAFRRNSSTNGEELYKLDDPDGLGFIFVGSFLFAEPQTTSTMRFRLCVPACGDQTIQVSFGVFSPGDGDPDDPNQPPPIGPPAYGSDYPMIAFDQATIAMNDSSYDFSG